MNHVPDPQKHKFVSFVKSLFRVLTGFSLMMGQLEGAGLLLILAEILGVIEELV